MFTSALLFLVKLLVLSWRVKWENPLPEKPVVIGLWHCDLPASLAAFRKRGISVLISQSKDGEKFANLSESLGYNVFRGSTSRGQEQIRHLLEALKNGHSVGMALDGPKGPPLAAKPGAAWLAEKSNTPLILVEVKYSKALTLKTWDKMKLPYPFSSIRITTIRECDSVINSGGSGI